MDIMVVLFVNKKVSIKNTNTFHISQVNNLLFKIIIVNPTEKRSKESVKEACAKLKKVPTLKHVNHIVIY
jgi:hypothetical protein